MWQEGLILWLGKLLSKASAFVTSIPRSSVTEDHASSTLRLHTICVRCGSTGEMTVGSSNGSVVTEWDTQTQTRTITSSKADRTGTTSTGVMDAALTSQETSLANPNRIRR